MKIQPDRIKRRISEITKRVLVSVYVFLESSKLVPIFDRETRTKREGSDPAVWNRG